MHWKDVVWCIGFGGGGERRCDEHRSGGARRRGEHRRGGAQRRGADGDDSAPRDPNRARDRAASDTEGTDNAKGSASTLEGSYLAPSDWHDRDAIDASEGRVALASAREARVHGNVRLEA